MRPEQAPPTARVSPRPRRPWFLVAAALSLALLSAWLWAKWTDSRTRADRLQAELRQVYAEAETLRTQAMRAQRRIDELERRLRTPSARDGSARRLKPLATPKSVAP